MDDLTNAYCKLIDVLDSEESKSNAAENNEMCLRETEFAEVLMSEFPDCNMRSTNSVTNASLFTQSAPIGVEVALLKFFPQWKGRDAG